MWGNDASFHDATGIDAGVITRAHLQYGLIRQRQGGTAGDGNWTTAGTTNVDTSAKAVFIQTGSGQAAGATGNFVTFPIAYTYTPNVFVSVVSAATQNVWARVRSVSTTQFEVGILINTTTGGTSELVTWLAIGQ